MSNYSFDVIYVDGGEIVSLRHIESISFGKDSEEVVIDKLKNDVTIRLRTVSGAEYTASAINAYRKIHKLDGDLGPIKQGGPAEIAESIYERWIWLLKA